MFTDNAASSIELRRAQNNIDFENGRILFNKYIQSLHFELTFQDVERELQEIAVEYNHPTGTLLLAYDRDIAIGCVGIRKFDTNAAELKRMFVYPEYRGKHLGRKLLEMAITEASTLGYKSILLDTINIMYSAIKLYKSFDFIEIEPYRFNPIQGAVYMVKHLS